MLTAPFGFRGGFDPARYFAPQLYAGNGAVRSITGLGFTPDLVWIKNRDQADSHRLVDSARGATKELSSVNTNAEATAANGLTSFDSDGFSLGTGAGGYNDNAENFVAWCWRRSALAGFDIITYTGTGVARTIAHNLGVTPEFMIVKSRSVGGQWAVYHVTPGATMWGALQSTVAFSASSAMWNDTAPTASVFSLGTGPTVNDNGNTFVAYLWAPKTRFSAFGSYTGNGNAAGPSVTGLGFQPRFVLVKCSDAASTNWVIQDAARDTANPRAKALYPNLTTVESTDRGIDFNADGFQIKYEFADLNSNAKTYVYAAFA